MSLSPPIARYSSAGSLRGRSTTIGGGLGGGNSGGGGGGDTSPVQSFFRSMLEPPRLAPPPTTTSGTATMMGGAAGHLSNASMATTAAPPPASHGQEGGEAPIAATSGGGVGGVALGSEPTGTSFAGSTSPDGRRKEKKKSASSNLRTLRAALGLRSTSKNKDNSGGGGGGVSSAASLSALSQPALQQIEDRIRNEVRAEFEERQREEAQQSAVATEKHLQAVFQAAKLEKALENERKVCATQREVIAHVQQLHLLRPTDELIVHYDPLTGAAGVVGCPPYLRRAIKRRGQKLLLRDKILKELQSLGLPTDKKAMSYRFAEHRVKEKFASGGYYDRRGVGGSGGSGHHHYHHGSTATGHTVTSSSSGPEMISSSDSGESWSGGGGSDGDDGDSRGGGEGEPQSAARHTAVGLSKSMKPRVRRVVPLGIRCVASCGPSHTLASALQLSGSNNDQTHQPSGDASPLTAIAHATVTSSSATPLSAMGSCTTMSAPTFCTYCGCRYARLLNKRTNTFVLPKFCTKCGRPAPRYLVNDIGGGGGQTAAGGNNAAVTTGPRVHIEGAFAYNQGTMGAIIDTPHNENDWEKQMQHQRLGELVGGGGGGGNTTADNTTNRTTASASGGGGGASSNASGGAPDARSTGAWRGGWGFDTADTTDAGSACSSPQDGRGNGRQKNASNPLSLSDENDNDGTIDNVANRKWADALLDATAADNGTKKKGGGTSSSPDFDTITGLLAPSARYKIHNRYARLGQSLFSDASAQTALSGPVVLPRGAANNNGSRWMGGADAAPQSPNNASTTAASRSVEDDTDDFLFSLTLPNAADETQPPSPYGKRLLSNTGGSNAAAAGGGPSITQMIEMKALKQKYDEDLRRVVANAIDAERHRFTVKLKGYEEEITTLKQQVRQYEAERGHVVAETERRIRNEISPTLREHWASLMETVAYHDNNNAISKKNGGGGRIGAAPVTSINHHTINTAAPRPASAIPTASTGSGSPAMAVTPTAAADGGMMGRSGSVGAAAGAGGGDLVSRS